MNIRQVEFVRSALKSSDYPKDGRPEFAFVGRSNVGKSSLLNALTGRRGLAKVSGTPGKTRTINFFDVDRRFYLVDLPGYGYAKVAKALKDEWNRVLRDYLREREPLRMAAVLLDARHAPSPYDVEMLALLEEAEVPTLLVATKFDKLRASERTRNLNTIRRTLHLEEDAELIPFSAVTRQGVKDLLALLKEQLGPA